MLKVLALDLALTNAGLALVDIPLGKENIIPNDVIVRKTLLVETERQVTKQIRQNSDDLRRSREIGRVLAEWEKEAQLIFAEIPSGAQSARAATTFGIVLGWLGRATLPIIEVQKTDRGAVVAGRKIVSKDEVIHWAIERWPDAGWVTRKFKGQIVPVDKNEHVADALAIAIAGSRTQQFRDMSAAAALMMQRAA